MANSRIAEQLAPFRSQPIVPKVVHRELLVMASEIARDRDIRFVSLGDAVTFLVAKYRPAIKKMFNENAAELKEYGLEPKLFEEE